MRKRTDICGRQGDVARQLPLDGKVDLVDVGILELRGDAFDGAAGPRDECGLAGRIDIRKQAATRRRRGEGSRIGIEIGKGIERALAGLWPEGEWNGVPGLIPLIAGDIAEKDAHGPAD